MFGVNWSDPESWWLNVTNLGLGLVVLICVGAVVIGVLQELNARRKLRAQMKGIDRELRDLVSAYRDGHASDVPGLGLILADGGEPEKEGDRRPLP
jgi:hypothetical protein